MVSGVVQTTSNILYKPVSRSTNVYLLHFRSDAFDLLKAKVMNLLRGHVQRQMVFEAGLVERCTLG